MYRQEGTGQTFKLPPELAIASGGFGQVFRHPFDSQACIKIYLNTDPASLDRQGRRIRAMIERTPDDVMVNTAAGPICQLTWPTDVITLNGGFAGFVMPNQ